MECRLSLQQYEQGLKEGRILALRCLGCKGIIFPSRIVCDSCQGTNMEVMELKGLGKIRTFTTNYVAAELREPEAPYVVVVVELEESPWIMGRLDGVDPREMGMDLIGRKVALAGCSLFAGDKYSFGEKASPLFKLV